MAEAGGGVPSTVAAAEAPGDEEALPSPAGGEAVSKPAAIVAVQTPEIVILPDTTSPDGRLPPRYLQGYFMLPLPIMKCRDAVDPILLPLVDVTLCRLSSRNDDKGATKA